MIDQLLKLPYFKQLSKLALANEVNILKEYAYLDMVTGQKGIIDLVIIQGNQVTILDYKTNNIEDPNYVTQLQSYASYLTSRGLKVESMYLISLTKATIKRL